MARPRYTSPTAGAVTAHALRLGMTPGEDPDHDAAQLVAKAYGSIDALQAALRRILGSPGAAGAQDLDRVRGTAVDLLHRALAQIERPRTLAG